MSAHTPGPWEAEQDCANSIGIVSEETEVARICPEDDDLTEQEWADARLIAAAPDLLKACKAVASFAVSWEPLTPGDIAEVTAAIAKAEGRP